MRVLKTLLSFLFPTYCIGCNAEGKRLCKQCQESRPPAPPPSLPYCTSLYPYRDPIIKRAIWHLKYGNERSLAPLLVNRLSDLQLSFAAEHALYSDESRILIIPIPLDPNRYKTRGYNQATLLAGAVARILGYPALSGVLKCTRTRPPQTHFSSQRKRKDNAHNRYAVTDPSLVKDMICILVDDVTTTGATLADARRALLHAGADSVYAITIAH